MHLQLLTRTPSSHPLFQRLAELAPRHFRWNQSNDIKRRFRRRGPVATAYMSWGRYGMLCGLLESLSDHPIEGEVTITVSQGSYDVSGSIEVYDPSRQSAIYESLLATERVACNLSVDASVTSITVSYSQQIKEIQGGVEVR